MGKAMSLVTGRSKVVTKLSMCTEMFRVLSRGARVDFGFGSNSTMGGNSLLKAMAKSVQILLSKREITLGCLREVDNVTACAGRISGLLRKDGMALLSAEGAAPGYHIFRGCTMHVNNKYGRECGLSSKMLLGSGRVKTTKDMTGTMTVTGRCTPFIHGVRVRMRAVRRMGRTMRTKTSVVVLSGVAPRVVGRTMRLVTNQTRARYSKGVAGRGVTGVLRANISFISDNTLARSTPVLSVSVGGLRTVWWRNDRTILRQVVYCEVVS